MLPMRLIATTVSRPLVRALILRISSTTFPKVALSSLHGDSGVLEAGGREEDGEQEALQRTRRKDKLTGGS